MVGLASASGAFAWNDYLAAERFGVGMNFKRKNANGRCDWLILTFLVVATLSVVASERRLPSARASEQDSQLAARDASGQRATREPDVYWRVDETPTVASVTNARRVARAYRVVVTPSSRALIRVPQFFASCDARAYRVRVVAFARAQQLFLLFLSLRN